MVDEAPQVTLVVATYNHGKYVDDCLASVAAQTLRSFDLIITDDASTDDSLSSIRRAAEALDLDARTIFNERNRGICATFNLALQEVRTPYVAFLAMDDSMEPERLERQLAFFEQQTADVAFVYSDVLIVDDDGELTGEGFYNSTMKNRFDPDPDQMNRHLLEGNFIPAPSVIMRTSALREVGGYDEQLVYEDYDVWCRLARAHRVAFMEPPLVRYRRGVTAAPEGSLADALQTTRRVRYLESNIWTLDKHFGRSPEIDRILAGRSFSYAVEAYKRGSRNPSVYRAMRRHLRLQPSLRDAITTSLDIS